MISHPALSGAEADFPEGGLDGQGEQDPDNHEKEGPESELPTLDP